MRGLGILVLAGALALGGAWVGGLLGGAPDFDRGGEIEAVRAYLNAQIPGIEESISPVDEDFKDGVVFALLRDGADSERHGDMLRALDGPFAEATAHTFWDEFRGLNLYLFVLDGRVVMGQVITYGAPPDQELHPIYQAWADVMDGAVTIAMAEPPEAVSMANLAQIALESELIEQEGEYSAQRAAAGQGIYHGNVYFPFIQPGGGSLPEYWFQFSNIADRCPYRPEEPVVFAAYLCTAGTSEP